MLRPSGVIVCEWVFVTLAYITVSARVWVRLYLKRTKILLSDIFLLAALVSAQGLLICDTLTYHMGQMDNFTNPDERLLKIRFATNYFFDFGIYLPKFSIIAFYYVLVPRSTRSMRIILHALTIVTVAASLFTLFADTFWCGRDPSFNWQGPADSCSVFTSMDLMRANWSLNFFTEVMIVIYPFPIVVSLMLQTKREKFGLGALFAMGFITIGVSIGRFITMIYVDNSISIYIWATAEFCISIIIVALTALRPMLKRLTGLISTNLSKSNERPGHQGSTTVNPLSNRVRDHNHSWLGTSWGRGVGARSHAVATRRSEDSGGSEIELTGKVILKMQEVIVSREPASSQAKISTSSISEIA